MSESRPSPVQGEKSPSPARGGSEISRRRLALLIGLAVGAACALLGTIGLIALMRDGERALPGVQVEGQDVSRLTRAEIQARVEAWARTRAAQKLALSLAGAPLVLQPQSLGFRVDAAASARRALAVGRGGGGFSRALSLFARMLHPESVPAEVQLDPIELSALEDEWQANAIKDPPYSGGISVEGTTVTALYPRSGSRLDRARIKVQLIDALRTGRDPGPLALRSETPAVSRAAVDGVAEQARAMLNREVVLDAPDDARKLAFTPAQLGTILRVRADEAGSKLELECAPEATHLLLESQRAQIERAPESARFVIDAQDRVHVQPGRPGVLLDDRALASALCLAAQSPTKSGILPLSPGAEPALSTAAAEQAGIVGLVGSYTTRHACCQPRVENIHHIADMLDGTLVRPGDTFSVNQVVGPRTIKNGFRPAPSIEDGDMVDTVGGGVSQFATTLFNALFYGGYDILERQPHSYWFTRYPMGYDATLSYPHPDIVFKNDTDACALIKTSYTDTSITVKVYGDNGGRKVRAEVSDKQNIVMPPVELVPNPRLDADEEKTREGGMIGWTVTVKRTLTYPDGKTKEERRKVTYKPRARRVEVHPCRIPAGEPGHTGERCPVPEKEAEGDSATPDAGAK
jgi:vancomycin resistance protein YoaR